MSRTVTIGSVMFPWQHMSICLTSAWRASPSLPPTKLVATDQMNSIATSSCQVNPVCFSNLYCHWGTSFNSWVDCKRAWELSKNMHERMHALLFLNKNMEYLHLDSVISVCSVVSAASLVQYQQFCIYRYHLYYYVHYFGSRYNIMFELGDSMHLCSGPDI